MHHAPNSPPAFRLAAFTLIELLTVIAIIGILAAIIIPTVGTVRNKARAVQCISNLRQMHAGIMLYANDHKDQLPFRKGSSSDWSSEYWHRLIYPYIAAAPGATPDDWSDDKKGNRKLYQCPNDDAPYGGKLSFGFNRFLADMRISGINNNPYLLSDATDFRMLGQDNGTNCVKFNHSDKSRANVIRFTGSVTSLKTTDIVIPIPADQNLLWYAN
ncbi:prepilin-type N-terminal cleavage/methylation domain-containing protein [Opitutaceae bacterium TAV1]|nr:prepilin-type N-terminal cleavage/methylation domain-containing protein [Opitutaceae bacterium TAV1]